jgi:hypothetical protein
MTLNAAMQPPGAMASGRFFRTGYLPTYAAAIFLLVLVWGGAPGRTVNFGRAWQTANHLGAVQALLLTLAVTLATILLQPLQLSIVRVLEGEFPRWLGADLARKAQLRRKRSLTEAIQAQVDKAVDMRDSRPVIAAEVSENQPDSRTADRDVGLLRLIQEAGAASTRVRSRFPFLDHSVRPTALGNALAAMEDSAGAPYGLDAAVIWPRLYPVLGEQVRAIVDDLRDGMDAAARLAATNAATAVAALGLLVWHSGWRALLALVPLAIAILAYTGAIRAATSFGMAVQVAFDLHRFDLLQALRLPLPADLSAELDGNRALSNFLRQGVPPPLRDVAPPRGGTAST